MAAKKSSTEIPQEEAAHDSSDDWHGTDLVVVLKETTKMTFTDLHVVLGVMIAFATLILKFVEVSRSK
jgi:hypothetical protein